MSIENPTIIDLISTDRMTGHVVLTISDHLDWSDSITHQMLLQTKLNRYLAFVESGEILQEYPAAKGKPIEFRIVFKFPPDNSGKMFLAQVRQIIGSAGFKLQDEVFSGAAFN